MDFSSRNGVSDVSFSGGFAKGRADFKTAAFDRSATSPYVRLYIVLPLAQETDVGLGFSRAGENTGLELQELEQR